MTQPTENMSKSELVLQVRALQDELSLAEGRNLDLSEELAETKTNLILLQQRFRIIESDFNIIKGLLDKYDGGPAAKAHYSESLKILRQIRKYGVELAEVTRSYRQCSRSLIKSKIKALKYANAELLEISENLEKEKQKRDNIALSLSTVAHDLKSVLISISGYSHLLLEKGGLSHDQVSWVKQIQATSEHGFGVIFDVLDIEKIESGTVSIRKKNYDLRELISKLEGTFALEAKSKNIVLNSEIEKDVPTTYYGDRDRLMQVLSNLVSNSLEHSKGERILIKVGFQSSRALLNFEVTDSGIGLRSADPPDSFDKDVGHIKLRGRGLGLRISTKIAKALGGELSLKESEPEKGSTISLTIPYKKERIQIDPFPKFSELSPIKPDKHDIKGMSILICEDDVSIQQLYSHVLTKGGATVSVAQSGEDAVKLVSQCSTTFDLILIDINLPGIDGFEASARIRAGGYRRGLVALTAGMTTETASVASKVGITHCYPKPSDPNELVDIARAYRPLK